MMGGSFLLFAVHFAIEPANSRKGNWVGSLKSVAPTIKKERNPDNKSEHHLYTVSRLQWKARPPLFSMKRHKIRLITIHHTATRMRKKISLERKMRSLQAFSQQRQKLASGKMKKVWADVPYHYYIDWKGDIAEGRSPQFAGDTNTNYDPTGHLLIVVEGNFEEEEPTKAEITSLVKLLMAASRMWNVASTSIKSHREVAHTLCPGRNLQREMPRIRRRVMEMLKHNK